jgi:hypothetical protein
MTTIKENYKNYGMGGCLTEDDHNTIVDNTKVFVMIDYYSGFKYFIEIFG